VPSIRVTKKFTQQKKQNQSQLAAEEARLSSGLHAVALLLEFQRHRTNPGFATSVLTKNTFRSLWIGGRNMICIFLSLSVAVDELCTLGGVTHFEL
jgi:hypothetical protein